MTITYHSQPATSQDKWLVEKLQGSGFTRLNHVGYFVEVGAHNGLRHSNTLTLEESFGWTGLLIEANPDLYEQCKVNRPGCRCANIAVGPFNAFNQNFAFGDAYGGLIEYMSDHWLDGHEFHKSPIRPVATHSLQTVLDSYNAPSIIDYLSLDVEGAEYAILESFFQPRRPGDRQYQARYMTVEFLYDRLLLDKLERLLEPNYVLDEVRAFDACFIHRDLGYENARSRAA